jgi:hypothetical protein
MKRLIFHYACSCFFRAARQAKRHTVRNDHNAWKDHINYREAEVTLKEGKICFSPMDAEDVRKEQVPVGLIRIFWGPKEAWLKT